MTLECLQRVPVSSCFRQSDHPTWYLPSKQSSSQALLRRKHQRRAVRLQGRFVNDPSIIQHKPSPITNQTLQLGILGGILVGLADRPRQYSYLKIRLSPAHLLSLETAARSSSRTPQTPPSSTRALPASAGDAPSDTDGLGHHQQEPCPLKVLHPVPASISGFQRKAFL